MVLLGVLADDVVDAGDAGFLQVLEQLAGLGRVDGVDQGDLVRAADQVRVVGRAVGQGDQLVEEPPVPVKGPDKDDIFPYFRCRHIASIANRTLTPVVSAPAEPAVPGRDPLLDHFE